MFVAIGRQDDGVQEGYWLLRIYFRCMWAQTAERPNMLVLIRYKGPEGEEESYNHPGLQRERPTRRHRFR